MSTQKEQQAIAFAAMCQAASLVDQIANRGMIPQNNFETMVNSIFETNPPTVADIYGGQRELKYNLNLGFKALQEMIERGRGNSNRNIANYVLSMITLQSKLAKDSEMLGTLSSRIDKTRDQARYFAGDSPDDNPVEPSAFCHPNVVAGLASLYQDTISTFSFRINVVGDPRHLQQAENAAKIRTLLLAGIRAAMLWRQVGGSRLHLLMFKHRMRPALKSLLD